MEEKICPKCKTSNPVAANFCRHCRFEFPEATKNGTSLSPLIKGFRVRESDYTIGSTIHLEWEVVNATSIKLNDTDTSGSCEAEMMVDGAETITLTAENDYDKATRKIRLSPRPQPEIRSFSVSNSSIRSGNEVKLKWDFRNTVKATLVSSIGEIDVTHKTFIKVAPLNTENYRLVCYSCDDKVFVEQSLQVTVISPVVIRRFSVDKDVVSEADKVYLTWDVENATSIMLYPFMRDVVNVHRYEVSPSRTTEYRILASNDISQDEAIVSVGVWQLPKMELNLADSFPRIVMPSCDVNLSSFSDSLKKSHIDEWMTTKPIDNKVEWALWRNKLRLWLKKQIDIINPLK